MSTKIGSSFQNILQTIENATVLKESTYKNRMFADHEVYKYLDTDGDGTKDALLHTMTRDGVNRHEVTFYDDKNRQTDVYTSGSKRDDFFGLMETGKVWSHTQIEYNEDTGIATETYEKANNDNGELKSRTVRNFDLLLRRGFDGHVEVDRDGNGSLETSYDLVAEGYTWRKK